jgi:hypothetical protein
MIILVSSMLNYVTNGMVYSFTQMMSEYNESCCYVVDIYSAGYNKDVEYDPLKSW